MAWLGNASAQIYIDYKDKGEHKTMIEKKCSRTITRMLAWLLALAMLYTSMPMDGMRVYAEGLELEAEILQENNQTVEMDEDKDDLDKLLADEDENPNESLEEVGNESEGAAKDTDLPEEKGSFTYDEELNSEASLELEYETIDNELSVAKTFSYTDGYNQFYTLDEWFAGSGTEADPYKIYSIDDLLFISDSPCNVSPGICLDNPFDRNDSYFVLMNDITLNESIDNPSNVIGNIRCKGFDGNGHTLRNVFFPQYKEYMHIGGNGVTGSFRFYPKSLFESTKEIKNLSVNNAKIVFGEYHEFVSIIASDAEFMENCTVAGEIEIIDNSPDREDGYRFYGLAGSVDYIQKCEMAASIVYSGNAALTINGMAWGCGEAYDCVNNGNIIINSESAMKASVTGLFSHFDYILKNCVNYANIEVGQDNNISEQEVDISGIVETKSSAPGIIDSCINYGTIVNHTSGDTAGIIMNVWRQQDDMSIINCSNYGDITAQGNAAGIICRDYSPGVIEKCENKGNIYGEIASGIVLEEGAPYSGKVIQNCTNYGDIYALIATGIVYRIESDAAFSIIGCRNEGILHGSDLLSGIIGYADWMGESSVSISRCCNKGDIQVTNSQGKAGGILGIYDSKNVIKINDCYNSGAISQKGYLGGIVGCIGYVPRGNISITNCYNIGHIYNSDKSTYANAIFSTNIYGFNCESFSLQNLYYISDITKQLEVETVDFSKVFSCDDAEMMKSKTYKDFDFDRIWEMGTGDYKYPILRERSDEDFIEKDTILSSDAKRDNKSFGGFQLVDGLTNKPVKASVGLSSQSHERRIVETNDDGEYLDIYDSGKIETWQIDIIDVEGYHSFSVFTKLQPGITKIIKLYPDGIYSAQVELDGEKTDVLNDDLYITSGKASYKEKLKYNPNKRLQDIIGPVDGSATSLPTYNMNITIGATGLEDPNGNYRFQIVQNGKIIRDQKNDNKFIFVVEKNPYGYIFSDEFSAGYKVYVRVIDSTSGKKVEMPLGIKVSEAPSPLKAYSEDEFKLDFGKAEFTIPDSIPGLGGTKINYGLKKALPLAVSIDDNDKIKIALNAGTIEKDEDWIKAKENYDNLAEKAIKGSSVSTFGKVESFGAGLVDAKVEISGYGEGYYDNQNNSIVGSIGVILKASYAGKHTQYYFVGYVPVYLVMEGKVDGQAKGTLNNITYDFKTKRFYIGNANLEFKLTPSFKLKGGVGADGILSIGASGKVSLEFLNRFGENYLKSTLSADARITAEALIFEKDLGKWKGSWTIYESTKPRNTSFDDLNSINYANMSGANYVTMDYMEDRITTQAVNPAYNDNAVVTHAFSNAAPLLIKGDGENIYLCYLDGVKGRETQNQTAFVYKESVDGGKTWGNTSRFDDNANETADFDHDVIFDDGYLYGVWSDENQLFGTEILSIDSNDAITLMTKCQDLSISKVNTTTGETTVYSVATQGADISPRIIKGQDGYIHVAWLSKEIVEGSDYFDYHNIYTMCYTSSKSDFTEIKKYKLSLEKNILTMDLGYYKDRLQLVTDMDMDGDYQTQEDREIFLLDVDDWELSQLTTNNTIDAVPQFGLLKGISTLYWYDNGNISYSEGNSVKHVFDEENMPILGQEFSVISDENNTSVVWTTVSDEDGSISLNSASATNDGWTNAYVEEALSSEFTAKISGFQKNGELVYTYLAKNSNRNDDLESSIIVEKPKERKDTAVLCTEDEDGMLLTVSNMGNTDIHFLEIQLNDSIQTIPADIPVGESKSIPYRGIVLPERFDEVCSYELTVYVDGEMDLSENIFYFTYGEPDLDIETTLDYSGDEFFANIAVTNKNGMSTDAVVEIYSDAAMSGSVAEIPLTDIQEGIVSCSVVNLTAIDKYATEFFFKVIDKNDIELYTDNNTSVLYVGKGLENEALAEKPDIKALMVTKQKVNYHPGETLSIDDLEVYAQYEDEDSTRIVNFSTNIDQIDMSTEGTKSLEVYYEDLVESIEIYVANQLINETRIVLPYESCNYDGKEKRPEPEVWVGEQQLELGTDYILSYANNVNVGTASVVIQGIGELKGKVTTSFQINKALSPQFDDTQIGVNYLKETDQIVELPSDYDQYGKITDINITVSEFEETGSESVIVGTPVIKDGELFFTTKAGSIADHSIINVQISYKNYEDSTWHVVVTLLDKETVQISGVRIEDKVYDGRPITVLGNPQVCLIDKGVDITNEVDLVYIYTGTLANGEAYTYNSVPPVHAGQYNLKISISGDSEDYRGEMNIPFQIKKAPLKIVAESYAILTNSPLPTIYEYTVLGKGKDVLTIQPTVSCDVTDSIRVGEYPIEISGAQANSDYEIIYHQGVLLILDDLSPATIKFDLNGVNGTVDSYTNVPLGSKLEEPQKPKSLGCIFTGWYKEKECINEWRFDIDIVKANTILYAGWQYKYTVAVPTSSLAFHEKVIKGTKLELTSETNGAQIYYTNNPEYANSLDEKNGILYEDAITINEDVNLWAVAVKAGYKNSEIVQFIYQVLDESQDWGDVVSEEASLENIQKPNDIPTALWLSGVPESVDYIGRAITFPDMKVYWHKKLLNLGVDYTVKYSNNTKAGPAKVMITGKGNYAGTINRYFTINRLSLGTGEENSPNLVAPDIVLIENGKKQQGITTVTYKIESKDGVDKYVTLKKGTDFTYLYPENGYVTSGEYTILLEGKGNYTGTAVIKEKITTEKVLMSKLKYDKVANQPATGKAIELEDDDIRIMDGSYRLVKDKDYSLSYQNNVNPGTATVIVTGLGEKYAGYKMVTFKITALPINKAVLVGELSAQPYTGYATSQTGYDLTYIVKKGEVAESLVEGRDYTVSYVNEVNAGKNKASIIFTGKNRFTGTLKKNYTISPHVLQENEVTPEAIGAVIYQKGKTIPDVIVKYGDRILEEKKDYTISVNNNTAPNDGSNSAKKPNVIITGKGNFAGTITRNFIIKPSSLENVKVEATDITFADKPGLCKPTITALDTNGAKLVAGTDYDKTNIIYTYLRDTEVENIVNKQRETVFREEGETVDLKNDIIPIGTEIQVNITGVKNYEGSTQSTIFRYVQGNLSKATVKINPQVFTGREVELSKEDIIITLNKMPLKKTDYTILRYEKNQNKGTATVYLRGKGNYGGVKKATFKINAKSMHYNILYDANNAYMKEIDENVSDAIGSMKNSNISVGSKLTSNIYKRNGYIFKGWNTKPDGTGVSYDDKEVFSLKEKNHPVNVYGFNIRLYAQWGK